MITPSLSVKSNCDPFTSTNHLSVKEIESSIASLDANQIMGIAQSLIAEVMDRFSIGIQVTDQLRHIVQNRTSMISTERIHKYDRDSKIMKLLLPICMEKIADSFSIPSEFVQNGIVFDFLNNDKSGLLDQFEDEDLKEKILIKMDKSQMFSIKLKVDASEILRLKMELYIDGKLVFSKTATPKGFAICAKECTI